jgi:hypothetical protein
VDASAIALGDASMATSRWSGPGIVEGGPRQGAPTVVTTVVAGAVSAIVLSFPFPLVLTLAFTIVVGVGGRGGGAA